MAKTIYIAGHNGMVGSALVRCLSRAPEVNLLLPQRAELDLTNQAAVQRFFAEKEIDEVYLAAAKVGGIYANENQPADFIYNNLMIQNNVIDSAHRNGVNKLLFLGSSCIYPRLADQPMQEDALLTGLLEPTNEPYAISKIAGIKLCESYNRQYGADFRSVMPTNLYGEHDNFHATNSHVIPALMRRLHEAKVQGLKEVVIWGTGTPLREFLHVDDMASACVHTMGISEKSYSSITSPRVSHLNVGTGIDCSIHDLAMTMSSVVGYQGALTFDTSKPDGAPRKLLDTGKLKSSGWQPVVSLEEGLHRTYQWFDDNYHSITRGLRE